MLPEICIHFFPICATWPAHAILINFIVLIISDEWYKLWSSPLYNVPQGPITSSLLRPTNELLLLIGEILQERKLSQSYRIVQVQISATEFLTNFHNEQTFIYVKHQKHQWLK
jgi:hypothetical protein